jgi:hypothetical protein
MTSRPWRRWRLGRWRWHSYRLRLLAICRKHHWKSRTVDLCSSVRTHISCGSTDVYWHCRVVCSRGAR